jgi:hypothetical protein
MKKIITVMLFLSANSASFAQLSDFSKINMNISGFSITSKVSKSGDVIRSYQITPNSIDSYAEQKLTGFNFTVDVNGSFSRLDPIYHKVDLISLTAIEKIIKNISTMKEVFVAAKYDDLSEIQRLALFRKIAIAILISDDAELKLRIDIEEHNLIEKTLKPFNIKLNRDVTSNELRSFAKLVLKNVSIE